MVGLSRFIHRSISRKLAVYIIGTGLVVALCAMFVRVVTSYHNIQPQLETTAANIANAHWPYIEAALQSQSPDKLHSTLQNIQSHPEILAVRVQATNAGGQMVKAYYPADVTTFSHVYQPPLPSSMNATLEMDIDTATLYGKIKQLIVENLVLIATQAVIISALLIFHMERIFAKHLRAITRYADSLKLDNLDEAFQYSRKPHDEAPDELDSVALAINRMRLKLKDDLSAREAIERAWQKEKEEKLATQRKILAAEAANRAKSQFIATMSHEIRTPMNGIIGMIDLLNHTKLDDQQTHYVDIIQRSGASLINIINDILDYSKIEANKMTLEHVHFSLDDVLDECVQLFSATTVQNKVALYCTVEPTIPNHFLGDPTRLKQVLLNLLGNAFKFTEQGYVALSVNAESHSSNEMLLRFNIRDTGIGITPETHRHLFRAFKQADSSTTRRFGGTGLGLAISKKLVALMGGDIGLDNDTTEGAHFWFTVKLEAHQSIEASAEPKQNITVVLLSEDEKLVSAIQDYCAYANVTFHSAKSAGTLATLLSTPESQKPNMTTLVVDQRIGPSSLAQVQLMLHQRQPPTRTLLLTQHQNNGEALPEQFATRLTLPITRTKLLQAVQAFEPSAPAPKRSQPQSDDLSFLKVLVAEDNPVNQMVIEGLLQQFQIRPQFAKNGKEAVELATGQAFDVILMDCEMPELDGYQATVHIRTWEDEHQQPRTRIIALTAHVESEHQKRVFSSGMDQYLSKPVTLAQLRAALEPLQTPTLS